MWHVQYVMTASVWLRWQCTDTVQTKSLVPIRSRTRALYALYSLLYASFPPLCALTEPCNTGKPCTHDNTGNSIRHERTEAVPGDSCAFAGLLFAPLPCP